MTEPNTTEAPTPANAYELVEFMKANSDPAVSVMYDRLLAELGSDKANAMWTSACGELDYDANVNDAVVRLKSALGDLYRATYTAQSELRRLTDGNAWHIEFAEGPIGADIASFLQDIARNARAAEVLFQKASGES